MRKSTPTSESRTPTIILGCALAALAILCLFPASGSAAAPERLWQTPAPSQIAPAVDAGRFNNPRDVAANSVNGHLYVTEYANDRVSEFTPWGEFVKAWGWDVAPGAVDEEQEVRIDATAGEFRLGFDGDTTGDLPFDATAEQVQAALNGLDSVAAGGAAVNVSGGTGTDLRVYVVRFAAGPLAGADVEHLVATNGTAPLSGGSPTGATVSTRANGTPGGTGLEACTMASGCKKGSVGEGAGQFSDPTGVAVDTEGSIYVHDGSNLRAQKFNPAGEFELMFGGEVNKTTLANRCTAVDLEADEDCGAGVAGGDPGEFSGGAVGNYLAFNPVTETIFAGDVGRIQEFTLDGAFQSQIGLSADTATSLAADIDGNLYYALSGKAGVWKTGPAGPAPGVPTFAGVNKPLDVAVDVNGGVYALEQMSVLPFGYYVLGFEPSGAPIAGMGHADMFAKSPFPLDGGGSPHEVSDLTGLDTNLCAGSATPGNLFMTRFLGASANPRAYLEAFGTPPVGCEPPPAVPPQIEDQYATSVSTDNAVLRAAINPRFWADSTYYVEYGTTPCSQGGCQSEPAPPGALLTEAVVDGTVDTEAIFLEGLQPGTTYHYRFVAQSGGSSGEPVLGPEKSFKTFRASTPDPCPGNAQFRTGPGAALPDCRAYEMVSPLDKANGDVAVGAGAVSIAGLFRSSTSGERITYSSVQSFGETQAAPQTSQYLATRQPLGDSEQGWSTEPISPPMTSPVLALAGRLSTPYLAFSPDLCTAWLRTAFDPPLATGALAGFPNLYRRQNCGAGAGSYEALSTVEPPNALPEEYWRLTFQGASADGAHAIYLAPDNLTEDAPAQPAQCIDGSAANACQPRLYEHVAGQAGLRNVCILPTEQPTKKPCSAGTTAPIPAEEEFAGNFENAISADGERIFWTESGNGLGRIYVRIGGAQTLDVSKAGEALSKTSGSQFWSAAQDGTAAIFTTGTDLYHFEVDSEETTPIAEGVQGLLGTSEDATRVYFVAKEAGELNLYLWEKGAPATRFIGTLAPTDVGTGGDTPSPFDVSPQRRTSRVTPDGRHVAFMSSASLTGYDNTDVVSGQPDAEVFLYDATANGGAGELRCVSCNPSGARPKGKRIEVNNGLPSIWAAAKLPGCVTVAFYCGWERALHASRALAEDGSRLYFESHEALVPRDTNGVQDVYQWQQPGSGSCDPGDATFSQDSGGCVDLISSGQSPRESAFVDADTSGEDVFLTTLSSLVLQDYGLVDIYNAKPGGGFPPPPTPKPGCEGEACQSPPPPPPLSTPASAGFRGPGNAKSVPAKPRCPKGKRQAKRRGKAVCVPRKAKQKKATKKKRAGKNGRAAR